MAYKVRTSTSGPTKRTVYRLTVPPSIAKQLDPDLEFVPELTEDGILFRPVEEKPEPPSWVKPKKKR